VIFASSSELKVFVLEILDHPSLNITISEKSSLSQRPFLVRVSDVTKISSQLAVKSYLTNSTQATPKGITAHFGESAETEISKDQSDTTIGEEVSSSSSETSSSETSESTTTISHTICSISLAVKGLKAEVPSSNLT